MNLEKTLTVLLMFILVTFLQLSFRVKKEYIVFIPSVGIQETTIYANGIKDSKFYELNNIQDLIINELVTMFKVTCYLCIIYKEKNNEIVTLVPLFFKINPKLDVLKMIYSEIHPLLKD